jgi:glycine/D-amino acid oxidase-like deaminating enzyme/nitrite reductase/ring-hydroxylating ferredoxin subunit
MTTPVPTTSASSLWLDEPEDTPYSKLTSDVHVDVAVIGAGIAGVTTALLLKRDGTRVAVLEAGRVGAGVTGCNTAKATALQSTVYSAIRSRHGGEAAAVYADFSRAGVELIARLTAEHGIDCDLGRRPAFTYAADDSEQSKIEQEADAATEAGLPVALTDAMDVPYSIAGAVQLDDQVEFHPVRYVRALARAVAGDGSAVYERTRALGVSDGTPCRIRTPEGTVAADQVVVATHYPLLDRGAFFARLEAMRSYCIAARVEGAVPQGMSISAGDETRSIRSYGDVLVVGGEGHAAGSGDAISERYAALERFAREHWDVSRVTHRWSAQDPVPYDRLPVVGRYWPGSSRLSVASGFMKWGLSGGSAAGSLLADLLGGRENRWARQLAPDRVSLCSLPTLARLNAKVGADFVVDRLRPAEAGSAVDAPPGEARVVRDGLGKKGVFRDDDGGLHAVSLRCTHLGCLLRFNAAERSWDCTCHGSRFDVDGAVLEGPATQPLERRAVD